MLSYLLSKPEFSKFMNDRDPIDKFRNLVKYYNKRFRVLHSILGSRGLLLFPIVLRFRLLLVPLDRLDRETGPR